MLLVPNLAMDLDTRSLIRSTLVIRRLAVEGLDLQLERNAAGENNWSFNLERRDPTGVLPVMVEAAVLPGAKIRFLGPRTQRALAAALSTAEQRVRAAGMLDLTARGSANAQLINPYIKVTGTLGKPGVALDPSGALVNGGAAFATAGPSVVATTV